MRKFLIVCCAIRFAASSQSVFSQDAGLLGSWTFDEGKGDEVRDSSSTSNVGSLKGGPAWVAGKAGSALQVKPGTWVECQKPVILQDKLTIMTWVKFDAGYSARPMKDSQAPPLVYYGVDGNTGYTLKMHPASGKLLFAACAADDRSWLNVSTQKDKWEKEVWYHIAATYDASEGKLKIYVNGTLDNTADSTKSIFKGYGN